MINGSFVILICYEDSCFLLGSSWEDKNDWSPLFACHLHSGKQALTTFMISFYYFCIILGCLYELRVKKRLIYKSMGYSK